MALETIVIQSLQVTYVLLVVLTIYQVRKHYLIYTVEMEHRAQLRLKKRRQYSSQLVHKKALPVKKSTNNRTEVKKKTTQALQAQLFTEVKPRFQSSLPMPEVSFTYEPDEMIVVDETPLPREGQSSVDQDSRNREILNNYIDDFFFDPYSNEPIENSDMEFEAYHRDVSANDEQIPTLTKEIHSVS